MQAIQKLLAIALMVGAVEGEWTGSVVRYLVAKCGMDLAAAQATYCKMVGETPLCSAVRQGKTDVVAVLLAEGADMNMGDSESGLDPPLWRVWQVS